MLSGLTLSAVMASLSACAPLVVGSAVMSGMVAIDRRTAGIQLEDEGIVASAGTFRTREHRFRQQVSFDNVLQIGKVKVGGRIRLEQRWRENASGTAWRLRPQVKASVPIVGKVNFNLSHESFIDLNTQTFQGVEGYERMRNAASISWPLNKKFGVEVGYLEQHGFVPGGPDTNDHALTVGLNANF